MCPGCGRCGRGDQAPVSQRAPSRAGVARCGGGGRVSPGGVPATVVRGAWCQALSLPRPPVLWSGQLGFRDQVSRVRSVRAWGPSTGPTACALAGRRCSLWGWREGVPGGGAFHHCEGRLRSGAVPPPTARPLGELLRSANNVLWARVWGCGGPTLSPWPACSVEAACRGDGGGPSPGGVACHCFEGRLVSGAVPPPGRPSSGAGSQGSATSVSQLRSVPEWGPSSGPKACALVGRRCSLWGWLKGVPGGGAFSHCEGRLRSGAVLPLTACPLGGPLGSATHVLWARMCGCRGPTLSPWPPCPVKAVCRGGGGGPSPGGVACHRCEGRLVSGAVPPPAARPLERAARVSRPVCPACGRCGRGDPALAPQRAPLRAGVARCGGGGRASPGRGAFHHCEGRLRSGAVPPPTAGPVGGLLGSATHVLLARVCGCGGPTLSPWPACPVGAACRGGGGGPSPGGDGLPPL